ncbi:DUF2569 family protein [Escherichia coli]
MRLGICPIKKVAIGYKSLIITPLKLDLPVCVAILKNTLARQTPQRIGGWLLRPLAWLFITIIRSGVVAVYRCVIFSANISNARRTDLSSTNLIDIFITAIAMWYYTLLISHRFL